MYRIIRFFRDVYWWFQYRLNHRHAYHKPKCSLRPGYYDWDTRLTNTFFEEVCDFVEYTDDKINWSGTPEHAEAWAVLTAAADWWKDERVDWLGRAAWYWDNGDSDSHKFADEIENIIVPSKDKEHMAAVVPYIRFMWY